MKGRSVPWCFLNTGAMELDGLLPQKSGSLYRHLFIQSTWRMGLDVLNWVTSEITYQFFVSEIWVINDLSGACLILPQYNNGNQFYSFLRTKSSSMCPVLITYIRLHMQLIAHLCHLPFPFQQMGLNHSQGFAEFNITVLTLRQAISIQDTKSQKNKKHNRWQTQAHFGK